MNATANKAPRVFVLHRQSVTVDIRDARRYGEIVYVYDDSAGPRPSIWDNMFVAEAVTRMRDDFDFEPTRDYFLVVGNMAPLVMVLSALVWNYSVRGLLFDAVDRRYVERELGGANEDFLLHTAYSKGTK